MSEKTRAHVPQSFLEYQAVYREPVFDLNRFYSQISSSMFHAFQEWNLKLENISSKLNPANASEISIVAALLKGRVNFQVGLGSASLLVNAPNWQEAALIIKMANAGIYSMKNAIGIEINSQRASIAMHIQSESAPIRDRLSDVLRLDLIPLLGVGDRGYGLSIYKDDVTWLIDVSAHFPEALFVKIDRTFDAKTPLQQIAEQLSQDEAKLFDLLRLEVD